MKVTQKKKNRKKKKQRQRSKLTRDGLYDEDKESRSCPSNDLFVLIALSTRSLILSEGGGEYAPASNLSLSEGCKAI